ncbi:MAG: hypothetical protein ACHQF2_02075 [Flavobacteriales bacterium]
MNKSIYILLAVFALSSCGGLDPRELADGYCECYKKYDDQPDMSWKCDTLGRQNERKLRNNEEAQRAYNVRLQDCMEGN